MLNYAKVTQRIRAVMQDSEDDSDTLPDHNPVSGLVTFTPNMKQGDAFKVTDDDGTIVTVPALKITAHVIDGEIMHEGEVGVSLFAAGPNSNPPTVTYTASYSNLKAAGRPVELRDVVFQPEPGETLDLGKAVPVAGTTGKGIVQGPKGEKGDRGETGPRGPKGDKGDPGDLTEEELSERLFLKPNLTADSVLNDLSPGLYPVSSTTVASVLGLPEERIGFLRVIWLDTRGVYRRFIWEVDDPDNYKQWRATYWNGSRQDWYTPNAGMRQYSGTGYPEGNVVAPIGSIYTDLDATNGAIRWVKTSGTGSSGWVVEYGDTGWRDLRGMYVGYLRGSIQIRRVNSLVTWTMQVLTAEDQTPSWNQHDDIVQPGFLPSSHLYFANSYVNSESATGAVRIGSNGTMYTYGSKPQLRFDLVAQYPTSDPWPTSLPGTPA